MEVTCAQAIIEPNVERIFCFPYPKKFEIAKIASCLGSVKFVFRGKHQKFSHELIWGLPFSAVFELRMRRVTF